MLRIAHFTDATVDGVHGVVASIRLLTTELARSGHAGLVVSAGPLWRDGRADAHWMRSAPSGMGEFRYVLFPIRGMRDRVRSWRPDVIHVHTPGPLGAGAMSVARELGVPAVYTYHTDMHGYSDHYYIPPLVVRACTAYYGRHLRPGAGAVTAWRGGRYEAVEAANARIFEAARVIIAPTAAALRRCRTAAAYLDRVRVVPSPPAHFGTSAVDFRARYGIPAGAPVVLFVGRLSVEKGIPLLLDAFELLRAREPTAVLVLAGPGRRRVRAGVIRTGLLDGDGVRAAYQAATVFAFPSETDTQGLVLHEAARAGLPIVMVDRALHDAHPLAGAVRLAEPAAPALAAALADVIRDGGELGEMSRTRAAELTPARFAAEILAAYRDALTAGPG